ncbi:MAG TPA: dihydrofolate reductase family protein [Candidatus Angelobacter sp.]|nr:dihydrofolate reductase family protein [Candidatus Angelobacter sp.]
MPKLAVFNSISMDGYFTGVNGDLRWAYGGTPDPEWDAFVVGNAQGGGRLVFGRITYDLMTRYWPTPLAMQQNPVVAERMNNLPKIVFSRTMDKASWNNTRLIKTNMVDEVRRMKQKPGEDMVILGSGSIISQLAEAGLVDEFQMAMLPLILGNGKTMFEGMSTKLNLKLGHTRAFKNGNVVLSYTPRA